MTKKRYKEIEDYIVKFVDMNVNAFRAEVLTLKRGKHKSQMEVEADTKIDKGDLRAMFFEGACCKDGVGVGILLVYPFGVTYKFSFILNLPCTNNIT